MGEKMKLKFCCILFIILLLNYVYADKCPTQAQNKSEQEIKDIVEVFNNCPVAINYGMVFECVYTESKEGFPILGCYLPLTTEQCIELRVKINGLATGISSDWYLYTGSKQVYIYDLQSVLIYYIKADGEFKCIFDDVI